ncbi:MAG: 4-(cytidine 5'-diphospho)-2-C-methyl-D-erythritol kinase [Calditrichaeota bacterium]|nr:MAG: 4-(cytidine 5'-diphospho)-2-C-methyl-D-erythritol kinase [Calditrichota bacterium]
MDFFRFKKELDLLYTSNAKINLGLKIVGKRPDGYHNLETIFQEVSLSDSIWVEKSEEVEFESNILELKNNETNLCIKALRKLENFFGTNFPVKIRLEKKIPIGAGLGGGSSNAATILKAVCEIYKLEISDKDILNIASGLGADVPFFLKGKSAFAYGIGDKLEKIELPKDYKICLVFPKILVSSAWAYSNLKINLTIKSSFNKFGTLQSESSFWNELIPNLKNDFEDVVFKKYGQIREVKDKLNQSGSIKSLMSGSGSCVFGIFKELDEIKLKKMFEQKNLVFFAKPI